VAEFDYEKTVIPYYVLNNRLYPIAMSKDEFELVQISMQAIFKKMVVMDMPQGEIKIIKGGETK